MRERKCAVLDRLVADFTAAGLPARRYTVAGWGGFAALGVGAVDVECVEARLGPSPNKPGYTSYAVAQTFLPRHPSLALTFLVELRDEDRQPSSSPAIFGVEVDAKFSTRFLPIMYQALNSLDPTGRERGILVQSYNSKMTLRDLLFASFYTAKLLMRFKRDGQLAMIAVDYYDRLTVTIAQIMEKLKKVIPDIHLIAKTETISELKIPLIGIDEHLNSLSDNSTALDRGFEIAIAYLDGHYLAHGGPAPTLANQVSTR